MKRVLKWIEYILLTLVILTIATVFFLLNSTNTIKWASDRYAPRYGFTYKQISGTLLTGLEVEALTFKKDKLLDRLKIGWNPASILSKKVSITHLEASGLNVENIKKVVEAFISTEPKEKDTSPFILPVSIGVGELQLRINPFEWNDIGFKDTALDGKNIVYYGEGVDVDNLSLSIDTNVTTIELSGGIQEKNIRLKQLSIVDIDTIAFQDVIKKMIAIKLHEEIIKQVEPEVEHYKAGRKHLIPKSVLVDSALVTVKPAAHPQVRLNQGELSATSIKVDIYRIIDLQPNAVQVNSLSLLVDTNLSRLSLESKLENETISVESLSLLDIDTIALIKLFESIKNSQTVKDGSKATHKNKRIDANRTANPLLPKFLHLKHLDTSIKSAIYDPIEVNSTEINVTNVKFDIGKLVLESGEINVNAVTNFATLMQHGAIENNQIQSKGTITPFKELFETYNIPLEGDTFGDIPLKINADKKQLFVDFDLNAGKVFQDKEGLKGKFSTDYKKGNFTLSTKQPLALKNIISLPGPLQAARAAFDLHIPLDFANITPLNATAKITSNIATIDANITYDKVLKVLTKTIFPKESLLRNFSDKLNLDVLSPLQTDLTIAEKVMYVDLKSKGVTSKVKFNPENKDLDGNMAFGSAKFTFKGNLEKEISSKYSASSLQSLLNQINTVYAFDPPPLDGDVKISATLKGMKDLELKLNSNRLTYNTKHTLNDTMISLGFANSVLTLNQYRTTFQEQKIFATKPSVITLKEGNVEIAPLWINDELKVTGRYNIESKSGEILAYADPFNLSHEIIDLASRIDLKSRFEGGKTALKGTITIEGGEIHYDINKKRFASDRDIVIVQKSTKKKPSPFMENLTTSVRVTTEKPLLYQTADADIKAKADLHIQKAPGGDLYVLGTIEILKGSSYRLENKKFIFKKSIIAFTGDINEPILDIAALYRSSNYEITIQVTGTSTAPNIILSSIPSMSRQEILSMILFDSRGGGESNSGDNMMKMLGGGMARSVLSGVGISMGGPITKSILSSIGIKVDNIPFLGKSSDANQSQKSIVSFFSSDEEAELSSHEIHFSGQKNFEEKDLQKAMGVDAKKSFQFWRKEKPTINNKLLSTLEESLQDFYRSEGFYDAKFSIKTSKTTVSVAIDENEPVKIGDITVKSDFDVSDLIGFEKGEIFRAKAFISNKRKIIQELLKEGYCSYDLESKAYVDLDRHEADIKIALNKGSVCTFGKITVEGLETIDDAVVLSRVRVKEGERFNIEKIQKSYDALYGLDAFDALAVNYDRKLYNVVPIDIVGSEVTKPWYFKGGAGYESSTGIQLSAEVIRTNFKGNAKQLGLSFLYSKIEQVAEINYFVPALFSISDFFIDMRSEIGYSNFDYTGFVEKKGYAQAFLAYANERMSVDAGFSVENIDIALFDDYKFIQEADSGNFLLAYPFLRFSYDGRDSKTNPKYGYYIAGMIEYALPYDVGASAYLKYGLEGRAIYSFGDLTLAAVAKAGSVDQIQNEIPESKLFFAGGAYSNRAYGYKRVGVILSPTSYGIEGGSTGANLSVEANYPIWEKFYGAVFTDNTLLTNESYDFNGDILSSAGAGVRYITPIGPIKIDFGMNVRDTSQHAIHFQIGQSF